LARPASHTTSPPGQLSALLDVTLCFHVYTYTLNDVVDLWVNRINPARRQDLLVRGVLTPRQVLLIALIQALLKRFRSRRRSGQAPQRT
jgi:4-hydroxybenzoate polyprenyltransferase